MLYAWSLGLAKTSLYSLNPPSLLMQEKHKIWTKGPEWNIAACERKFLLFHTHSTGHHQFLTPFQPKRKNGDMRKMESHSRSKKKEKLKEKILKMK